MFYRTTANGLEQIAALSVLPSKPTTVSVATQVARSLLPPPRSQVLSPAAPSKRIEVSYKAPPAAIGSRSGPGAPPYAPPPRSSIAPQSSPSPTPTATVQAEAAASSAASTGNGPAAVYVPSYVAAPGDVPASPPAAASSPPDLTRDSFAEGAPVESKTGLYVGVGAAALALGVALYFGTR